MLGKYSATGLPSAVWVCIKKPVLHCVLFGVWYFIMVPKLLLPQIIQLLMDSVGDQASPPASTSAEIRTMRYHAQHTCFYVNVCIHHV